MIQNCRGLTIFEVLVVIAILAIVSGFVVPHIISWRSDVKLRGAANNLKGDLELAKSRAIRENYYVAIRFYHNRYEVFVDNGAGGGDDRNWIRDGSELLLRNRALPGGVSIDLASTSFGILGDKTRFTGRGHCSPGATVVKNSKAAAIRVTVNRLGGISLKKE
jgi:type IV fimbrial biogenesis protein FimT